MKTAEAEAMMWGVVGKQDRIVGEMKGQNGEDKEIKWKYETTDFTSR